MRSICKDLCLGIDFLAILRIQALHSSSFEKTEYKVVFIVRMVEMMKSIDEIRQQLQSGNFELTCHALKRLVERNISRSEIIETGKNATIIEDYPEDKYSPSCLLLGSTINNRLLHLQVSRLESNVLTIITLYEPNQQEWIDYSQRRL